MPNRKRRYLDETNGTIVNPYNPSTWSTQRRELTKEQKQAVANYVNDIRERNRQQAIQEINSNRSNDRIESSNPSLYTRVLEAVPDNVGNNLERIRSAKQRFDQSPMGFVANFTPYGFVSSGLDLSDAHTNEAAGMSLLGLLPGGKNTRAVASGIRRDAGRIRLANISQRQIKTDAAKYATGISEYPDRSTLRTWKYGAPSVFQRYKDYMSNPTIPLSNSSLRTLERRAETNVMRRQVGTDVDKKDLRWLINNGYGGENFKADVKQEYDALVEGYTRRLNARRSKSSTQPLNPEEGVRQAEVPTEQPKPKTPSEALAERNTKRKDKRKKVGKYSLRGGLIGAGIYGGGQGMRLIANQRVDRPYYESVQDTTYNYR